MTGFIRASLVLLATIVLGGASQISFQSARNPVFIIESVECKQVTSGSSTDTVYLARNTGSDRYPNTSLSMRAGSKKKVGSYFYPNKPGYLALYEEDSFTGDDEIGRFTYTLGEKSGTYKVRMVSDSAEYIVTILVRN